MKKFTKYLFIGVSLLFCFSATAQYSENTYMVSFEPGTTQQEIDQARSDLNSIELAITPITNMRLWKVISFPFPYPPTGEWIIDINDTEKETRSRSSINGGGLNYILDEIIGAPITSLLKKDAQLDCKGELSTYLPNEQYPVSVGVFDTGLNYFYDPNIPNYFFDLGGFNQWDHLNNDPIADDDNGHGSHMASIVSHTMNKSYGLGEVNSEPLVSYEIRKSFDLAGSGYMFEILDGLEHAALSGMNVASCSWSFKTDINEALASPLYTTLSKLASDYNILVVAAAGNDGENLNQQGVLEKYFPGAYDLPNILTATTYDCQGELAPFANYGIMDVDIAMPGVGLAGLESDDLVFRSGTSQSTALLAGIAASLGTHLENFHYEPIICAIMNSAEARPNLQYKVKSGGVIDAEGALNLLANCGDNVIPRKNNSQWPENGKTATIFPNPAMDQITIDYMALADETLHCKLSDMQGRVLKANDFEVIVGDNLIYWNLEGLPAGFYHLTLKNSNEMETYKIIVEK